MSRLEKEQKIREAIRQFDWSDFGLGMMHDIRSDEWLDELAYQIAEKVDE